MLNKHKLFLLCAKWIPVVTAIGILVTNTIAYYGCNDIVVDIFNFNRGKHFDEVYATYQVDNMYHTDNKGNKITSPMFTPIDVRKLYDKKFKSINSNITFWDVYVVLNAQYHDNIELYKEWFGEDNIENIKDKIIESAIVNWFEDEDAGIEKVWNYFRAI